MRIRQLFVIALVALGIAACTHTYTEDELVQEELKAQKDAASEEKYDEALGRAGGENAAAMRETGEMVERDSDR